ncbi:MAG: hypothetical protein Q8K24_08900 [Hydrogenophaga sp.]|nr:hypothetical protein [Hydrogenophaga sp.]
MSDPPEVTCHRCGEPGLHWCLNTRWQLLDADDKPHTCDPHQTLLHSVADFEDLDK